MHCRAGALGNAGAPVTIVPEGAQRATPQTLRNIKPGKRGSGPRTTRCWRGPARTPAPRTSCRT
eukprot:7584806-Pyramimonas_sp.AAC.1